MVSAGQSRELWEQSEAGVSSVNCLRATLVSSPTEELWKDKTGVTTVMLIYVVFHYVYLFIFTFVLLFVCFLIKTVR